MPRRPSGRNKMEIQFISRSMFQQRSCYVSRPKGIYFYED